MNWHYVAHAIRDIFVEKTFTTIYGPNVKLAETLRTSEHGIGAFILVTQAEGVELPDYSWPWEAGVDNIFFGEDKCDLFLSFNYDTNLLNDNYDLLAQQLKSFLKINGMVFLVNPGKWANGLGEWLSRRPDLEKEIRRYSMFRDEDILVYENI
jgi:hypothetical protein